nr:MAG: ORF2 [Torque teno polar bear virus 39]
MKAQQRWRMEFKKREAVWRRSISISHQLFCSCDNYLNHFIKCHSTGGGLIGGDVSPGEGVSFTTNTPGTEDGGDGGGEEGETHR